MGLELGREWGQKYHPSNHSFIHSILIDSLVSEESECFSYMFETQDSDLGLILCSAHEEQNRKVESVYSSNWFSQFNPSVSCTHRINQEMTVLIPAPGRSL